MGLPDTTFTLPSQSQPQPVFCGSVFTTHELSSGNFQVKSLQRYQPDWLLAILIFCFILIAWTQVFYHKRIQQVFRAPFSKRFINQLTRDGNLFKERVSIALGIVYVLTFSLLLYEFNEQVVGFSFPRFMGIGLYLAIVALNIAVLTAKVALVQLLGIIFRTRETTYNYLLNLLIFALLSGPVILIVLVFVIYIKSVFLLNFCVIIFIAMFVFRFVRGFFIGIALTKFSYLFLFVYLCTLEILPLLVLLKIILNQAHSPGV